MQACIGGLAQLPAPDHQPLFQPPQSKKAKRKGLVNLAKGGKQVVKNVMKGVGLTPGMHRDETKPLVRTVLAQKPNVRGRVSLQLIAPAGGANT